MAFWVAWINGMMDGTIIENLAARKLSLIKSACKRFNSMDILNNFCLSTVGCQIGITPEDSFDS